MNCRQLHIGILNLMHHKINTNHDFQQILTRYPEYDVQLHFYYPRHYYDGREIPTAVLKQLQPLDLAEVSKLDAFIITGSPIEQLPFEDVTYIHEIQALLKVLEKVPQRLYFCWGAMVALHELYQIGKHDLPQKIFGAYPHQILTEAPILSGLTNGFIAPHARYAESNIWDIEAHPELVEVAKSRTDNLFLIQNQQGNENFLFSHLEYGGSGLADEYQREVTAHPERHYAKPHATAASVLTLEREAFPWQHTQQQFFKNWLQQIQTN
ncbi:homoserine O-succinyltransferase [Agrilactobacillus yilanensis]|uniref:Serine O-acetyltransferase n=1 Tax=Agrilactobacillus yilanensis TaxID=2485997 RepID=A0ABW4J3A9_9LACO|nr:homoserine O-succinyltransferase [Agrilactobacillus yilanensis]